nr:MAG TPA: NYN ribonuclease and ATPase [Caudoviricetes sp.]
MGEAAFDEPFYISAWTLNELEAIKTNRNKDDSVRYKARQMAKLLDQHLEDGSYTIEYDMMQLVSADEMIQGYPVAPETTDTKICAAANRVNNKQPVTFCTDDICCKLIAHDIFNLPVCSTSDILSPDHYAGYKEVSPTPEDHAILYEHPDENIFCLIPNQYLIVHSDDAVDLFRWTGETHVKVDYKSFKTMMFDTVKAKDGDVYQKLAFDSLAHNRITMLHGHAGTGKSYLALAYMFKLLESHKIDKIIVFTNPCATTGAAKLGFYPGTRDEKLLDSQIGNMLGAKLGDKMMLERMLNENKIQLLPFSDIRGFDTTGMNCAVYITEAQNLDIEMMRLALQRIGEDCIAIIDGDYEAQVDMAAYSGSNNGMRRLSEVFRGSDFYGEVKLQNIYRSRIAALAQEM